jgi:hypothetical protein
VSDTLKGIALMVVGVALLTAPFGWKPVTAIDAAWFVAAGVFNATAHFLMIEARKGL